MPDQFLSQMFHRLNWKHILVHFIAFWLIGHAVQVFAYLNNLDIAEIIRTSNNPEAALERRGLYVIDLTKLNLTIGFGYTLGVFIAFIIALAVCFKRKWFWLNSFIPFALLILLGLFSSDGWDYVKNFLLLPGSPFRGSAYYIVNGVVLLLFGVVALFWRNGIGKQNEITTQEKLSSV